MKKISIACIQFSDRVIECVENWKKEEFGFKYIDKKGMMLIFETISEDGELLCAEAKKAMKANGVADLIVYNIAVYE